MASSVQLTEPFWLLARRLIPKPTKVHRWRGGRPRVPDRRVLAAILFVLRTGCQWKALDATDLGSGSTAHRRFQEWSGLGSSTGSGEWPPAVTMKCKGSTGVGFLSMAA